MDENQITIASAIDRNFTSATVEDRDGEPANIVDTLDDIAQSIRLAANWLGTGDSATSMGAIKWHGKTVADSISEAGGEIARSIDCLANAVYELASVIADKSGKGKVDG